MILLSSACLRLNSVKLHCTICVAAFCDLLLQRSTDSWAGCVGMYEDQLYIQPSVQMTMEVAAAATDAVQQGRVDMPRVRWNPYIITGICSVLSNI